MQINNARADVMTVNVTTHNGANAVFCSGPKSQINMTNSVLYTSGPQGSAVGVAYGCTARLENVVQSSGGRGAPGFSVISGTLQTSSSIVKTLKTGSPIFYVRGEDAHVTSSNSIGNADASAVAVLDAAGSLYFQNNEFVAGAGAPAGIALSNSHGPKPGSSTVLVISHGWIMVQDPAAPALWCGRNVVADVSLNFTVLQQASGVLLALNKTLVAPGMDTFTNDMVLGPADSGCVAGIRAVSSRLEGDVLAYEPGTQTALELTSGSLWTGAVPSNTRTVDGWPNASVRLDDSSRWSLTADSVVQSLVCTNSTLPSIYGNGFTLYYNSSLAANKYLGSKAIPLQNGGNAKPIPA